MDGTPAAPARNLLIDTLRAFALIGVYMVHMFEQYEIYWAAPNQNLTHTIFTTFFMGKAFSLLTLCFGLSFFLLMDRADRRGANFSGRFAWRMAVLALIGLAHSLVYRGDILMFEDTGYQGRVYEVMGDTPDLDVARFNDRASSIRIVRGQWEICEHANYQGRCSRLDADQFVLPREWNDAISSIRRVR